MIVVEEHTLGKPYFSQELKITIESWQKLTPEALAEFVRDALVGAVSVVDINHELDRSEIFVETFEGEKLAEGKGTDNSIKPTKKTAKVIEKPKFILHQGGALERGASNGNLTLLQGGKI